MDVINIFEEDNDYEEYVALEFIVYGIPRRIYKRLDHFHELDEHSFFIRFRLTKASVYNLLQLVEERLEYPCDINSSVSPINQLLICLRVFATGGHLLSLADFGGVHVSTASRIVVRVSEALASLAGTFIQFPSTPDAIKKSQNDFYEIASFPRVIGVIDGTHIRIQSPGGADAEVFRNRKSYFSINVQVVGNAHLEITDIVARWPGSSHDSTIFNHSRIRRNFELGSYPNSILLGDSGYNVRTYLLTPLLNPTSDAERLYNESHIRTRARIENIFGIWKRRFPILAYGCRLKLQTILTMIIATAVLHNIARRNGEGEPPIDENVDEHILQQRINDGEIPDIPVVQNQLQHTGFHVRRNLIDNFFSNL